VIALAAALAALRGQRGSASVELIGFLPLLGLAALGAWQVLLFAFTATAAENAARTGSRVEGQSGEGEKAAKESMSSWLRDGADASFEGTRGTVVVQVPIVFPPMRSDRWTVTETAELPDTER
jgi:hypothetical protein